MGNKISQELKKSQGTTMATATHLLRLSMEAGNTEEKAIEEVYAEIVKQGPDRENLEDERKDFWQKQKINNTPVPVRKFDNNIEAIKRRQDYSDACRRAMLKSAAKSALRYKTFYDIVNSMKSTYKSAEEVVAMRWLQRLIWLEGVDADKASCQLHNEEVVALVALGENKITPQQFADCRKKSLIESGLDQDTAEKQVIEELKYPMKRLFEMLSFEINKARNATERIKETCQKLVRGEESYYKKTHNPNGSINEEKQKSVQKELEDDYALIMMEGTYLAFNALNCTDDLKNFGWYVSSEEKESIAREWELGDKNQKMQIMASQICNPYYAILETEDLTNEDTFYIPEKNKDSFYNYKSEFISENYTGARDIRSVVENDKLKRFELNDRHLRTPKRERDFDDPAMVVIRCEGRTIIAYEHSSDHGLSAEVRVDVPGRYIDRSLERDVNKLSDKLSAIPAGTGPEYQAFIDKFNELKTVSVGDEATDDRIEAFDSFIAELVRDAYKCTSVLHNNSSDNKKLIDFIEKDLGDFAIGIRSRIDTVKEHKATVALALEAEEAERGRDIDPRHKDLSPFGRKLLDDQIKKALDESRKTHEVSAFINITFSKAMLADARSNVKYVGYEEAIERARASCEEEFAFYEPNENDLQSAQEKYWNRMKEASLSKDIPDSFLAGNTELMKQRLFYSRQCRNILLDVLAVGVKKELLFSKSIENVFYKAGKPSGSIRTERFLQTFMWDHASDNKTVDECRAHNERVVIEAALCQGALTQEEYVNTKCAWYMKYENLPMTVANVMAQADATKEKAAEYLFECTKDTMELARQKLFHDNKSVEELKSDVDTLLSGKADDVLTKDIYSRLASKEFETIFNLKDSINTLKSYGLKREKELLDIMVNENESFTMQIRPLQMMATEVSNPRYAIADPVEFTQKGFTYIKAEHDNKVKMDFEYMNATEVFQAKSIAALSNNNKIYEKYAMDKVDEPDVSEKSTDVPDMTLRSAKSGRILLIEGNMDTGEYSVDKPGKYMDYGFQKSLNVLIEKFSKLSSDNSKEYETFSSNLNSLRELSLGDTATDESIAKFDDAISKAVQSGYIYSSKLRADASPNNAMIDFIDGSFTDFMADKTQRLETIRAHKAVIKSANEAELLEQGKEIKPELRSMSPLRRQRYEKKHQEAIKQHVEQLGRDNRESRSVEMDMRSTIRVAMQNDANKYLEYVDIDEAVRLAKENFESELKDAEPAEKNLEAEFENYWKIQSNVADKKPDIKNSKFYGHPKLMQERLKYSKICRKALIDAESNNAKKYVTFKKIEQELIAPFSPNKKIKLGRWMQTLMWTPEVRGKSADECRRHNEEVVMLLALGEKVITPEQYTVIKSKWYMQNDNMSFDEAVFRAEKENTQEKAMKQIFEYTKADIEYTKRKLPVLDAIKDGCADIVNHKASYEEALKTYSTIFGDGVEMMFVSNEIISNMTAYGYKISEQEAQKFISDNELVVLDMSALRFQAGIVASPDYAYVDIEDTINNGLSIVFDEKHPFLAPTTKAAYNASEHFWAAQMERIGEMNGFFIHEDKNLSEKREENLIIYTDKKEHTMIFVKDEVHIGADGLLKQDIHVDKPGRFMDISLNKKAEKLINACDKLVSAASKDMDAKSLRLLEAVQSELMPLREYKLTDAAPSDRINELDEHFNKLAHATARMAGDKKLMQHGSLKKFSDYVMEFVTDHVTRLDRIKQHKQTALNLKQVQKSYEEYADVAFKHSAGEAQNAPVKKLLEEMAKEKCTFSERMLKEEKVEEAVDYAKEALAIDTVRYMVRADNRAGKRIDIESLVQKGGYENLVDLVKKNSTFKTALNGCNLAKAGKLKSLFSEKNSFGKIVGEKIYNDIATAKRQRIDGIDAAKNALYNETKKAAKKEPGAIAKQ